MLVEMARQDFEALSDAELVSVCTEPSLVQIQGRTPSERIEFMKELNKGQQALFMFRLLHPARNSVMDYQSWVSYFMAEPNYWTGIQRGLRFFGETSLIDLLSQTYSVLSRTGNEQKPEGSMNIQPELSPLFNKFESFFDDSIHRISRYIRTHAADFAQFQN